MAWIRDFLVSVKAGEGGWGLRSGRTRLRDIPPGPGYDAPAMAWWLLKTEPEEYSWDRLVADKKAPWTGVRNFEARNNLRLMKPGDRAFIYHSGDEKAVVGVAEVVSDAYADPTAEKGDWACIDLKPLAPCVRQLTLDEIRNTHGLAVMPVVTRARLSVQPVTDVQADLLLKFSKTIL